MVESTPSRQRRPPCKTNKEESDEAADAAALTYLLTYSKLMSVGTELAKKYQEIKRNLVPRSDNKNKENKETDKNKDKDKKGKKGGKKKGVNVVDAEEGTPTTTTTDAP